MLSSNNILRLNDYIMILRKENKHKEQQMIYQL